MAYKVRIEEIEATNQVAVYVKDGGHYLRSDGAKPIFTQQLLREGENPEPTLILSGELVVAIADAFPKPAKPGSDNELLATLQALHGDDRATIAWMQAVIAKIVGLQASTEEPVG